MSPSRLAEWVRYAKYYARSGQVPTYVGGLATAEPDWFGLVIDIRGRQQQQGEVHLTVPLMSVIKPFLLFHLLATQGEEVLRAVGTQPSEQPFNSMAQLEADEYFPRNPMLNSGAITLASMLPGEDGGDRCERLRRWLNRRAGCHLTLDPAMLESVRSLPNEQNRVIARTLAETGRLECGAGLALDTYEQICCLSGTLADIAALGRLLVEPRLGIGEHQQKVLALMFTCGLYEESGAMVVQVGLPMKSGVSGLVLAAHPAGGVIVCYSPPLNAIGNSIGGLFMLTQMSRHLKLSLLSPMS
ncbi:MAG: glutaminase [Cyanobacteria bacterium P01_A01_bin.135]